MRLEFPVPAKPWSTNQDRNLNPYERAGRIKQWKGATRLVYWQAHSLKGLEAYFGGPGLVRVHIPFSQKRKRDPHNYCGTVVKAVIDGLVMAGAWPDDTPEHVGHREPVLYKGDKVIVEITPMERTESDE